MTYRTSTAQNATSIVNHYIPSSIKLSLKKLKDFVAASETDKNLFWKLINGQQSTSRMNAFLVDGNLLTDRNKIREMWAENFESLGTTSDSSNFDNDSCHRVTARVHDVLQT